MKLLAKIPYKAELLVGVGQEVDFNTPLLKKTSTQLITVPIAQMLGFSADKIFMNLKKLVGDELTKGDLLAEHKAMFSTKQYFSEHDGLIKEINHQTGSLIIEIETTKKNLTNCFFKGEIAGIAEDYIEFKVKHYKEYDIIPFKDYFGAPVFYANTQTSQILTEEDVQHKCVCAEEIKPYDQIKLETFDTKALISPAGTKAATKIPIIEVKQAADFKAINELHYPNCIIGVDGNTIYFYE